MKTKPNKANPSTEFILSVAELESGQVYYRSAYCVLHIASGCCMKWGIRPLTVLFPGVKVSLDSDF
jgi:hypothetical protein